ncbi:hypothetical protein [Undibacterium sp.]|uniref:lysine 5,6-aminomutase reactivase subunit KamB n=1 Tax=Undibacterium sp. TaxID=1914977 RepID=UPI003752F559
MEFKNPTLSNIQTSPLWQRIHDSGMQTLAVMGMTKNTGKTVAMNHVLAQAAAGQVDIGLTSIGRDGEDRDQVFFNPKPPIMVWPGNLVATARETLQRAKVRWKLIDSTQIDSPMGEILVVKVLEYGEMEVAGASRGSDQLKVIARLRQCGASLAILDGALGRSHHASPAIADGVILATGAAIGGGIQDVIRKTRDRLGILGIKQADDGIKAQCEAVFTQGGVGIWDQQGKTLFLEEIATLNAGAKLMEFIDADVGTIAVSGAVGRQLWRALSSLAERHPTLTVVVADGTKLFIENTDLLIFQKLGAKLVGYRGINLTGITLNPFSPMGGSFDAAEFLDVAKNAFIGYDVCDVVLEATSDEKIKETGEAA